MSGELEAEGEVHSARSRPPPGSPPPPSKSERLAAGAQPRGVDDAHAATGDPCYFFDESVTAGLARAVRWDHHPLGPPEGWPPALKTFLGFLFRNRFPMLLYWGESLFCFFNDAFLPSLGAGGRSNGMGEPVREFWHDVWHVEGSQILQVLEGGAAVWHSDQLVPILRDGRMDEVYWTYSYSPLIGEGGKPAAVVVTVTETTRAVLAARRLQEREEAARRSMESLSELFRAAPFALALLAGPDHRFRFANAAYERYFLPGREYVGRSIDEVLPEAREQGFLALLDAVYKKGERHIGSGESFQYVSATGQVRKFHLNYVFEPMRSPSGEVEGILVAASDVTELEENRLRLESLTASLRDAVRSRDDFLSIASHELKTPLTSLSLESQLLRRQIARGDPAAFQAERIVQLVEQTDRQVRRLTRLVDDMLDIARVGSGKLTLEWERFDLGELARETVRRMEPHFLESGSSTPCVLADGPVHGVWDKTRVEQILTNLLTNALRYGRGEPVDVRVRALGNRARLCVRDRGVGIRDEAKERIFERFERAVDANEVSGLGLGLSIVRQLVDALGGQVSVESEPGKGSIFSVDLPIEPAPERVRASGIPNIR